MADFTFSDVRICGQLEASDAAAEGHILSLRIARRDGSSGLVKVAVSGGMSPALGSYLRVSGELGDDGIVHVPAGYGEAQVVVLPGTTSAAPTIAPVASPVARVPTDAPAPGLPASTSAPPGVRPASAFGRFGRAPLASRPATPASPAPAPAVVQATPAVAATPATRIASPAAVGQAPRAMVRRSSFGGHEDAPEARATSPVEPPAAAKTATNNYPPPNRPDEIDLKIPF